MHQYYNSAQNAQSSHSYPYNTTAPTNHSPSYHLQPLGSEGPAQRLQNNDDLTSFNILQPPFVRLTGLNRDATTDFGSNPKTQDEGVGVVKKQQKVARILDEDFIAKSKRPVSKKTSPRHHQRESQVAKPLKRQTKTGRNDGNAKKDHISGKTAQPPLDPKQGLTRQAFAQQRILSKRPSSAMPWMKPIPPKQKAHSKSGATSGARAGSAVTREASGSHGPTARNQKRSAGGKTRSPKPRQKESMNFLSHKIDNFVTAPDDRVEKPILLQRPSSAAVISTQNVNYSNQYSASSLLPYIAQGNQKSQVNNPGLEQLINHLAQAQAQTQRQPHNVQQTRELNHPADIGPPGQPQQITLQWHNKIHHNYYGGCNNHNYQNTAIETPLMQGEGTETFHPHPGSSRQPQNRGTGEPLNDHTGPQMHKGIRILISDRSLPKVKNKKRISNTRAKNLRRRPLGEKKFTEDLSSGSGRSICSYEHSRSYNASQSGLTSSLIMPTPNTKLARRLAVMEYYENLNNPNVFRQLKMDQLADKTNGKLMEGISKDERQKLSSLKRQLKIMLEQDKQRRSTNSRLDLADLDASGEFRDGSRAPALMHRNKSVGFLRDTKSASKAEKERIQRSAQYQQLLKMQAKQQETNNIQALVRQKSAHQERNSHHASKSKNSHSRSASSPPNMEKKARAVTKLSMNPLANSSLKDTKQQRFVKQIQRIKAQKQKNGKGAKLLDAKRANPSIKLLPEEKFRDTPTKGPSFNEIRELGKRAIDIKNRKNGQNLSSRVSPIHKEDTRGQIAPNGNKHNTDWQSHLLEPDQFQLNHLQELFMRQSSESFTHPQGWDSAGQLDPQARVVAIRDFSQKELPQQLQQEAQIMSNTMPLPRQTRQRETVEQSVGPPIPTNNGADHAFDNQTASSQRVRQTMIDERSSIGQNTARQSSENQVVQSQDHCSRVSSTSMINTDLSERASAQSAHPYPQSKGFAKPDSQRMSVNSRCAPTFDGSKHGESHNLHGTQCTSKRAAKAVVGKATNRIEDLQIAGKDLQQDRQTRLVRAQTITPYKKNHPKMFSIDGSQSIDEPKNDKAIHSEQQDSIKNHQEANSSAVITSNKLTGVPISVHQIPLQVPEEADKTASASNNRSSNMPSNVFLNIDAHSRDEPRSPTIEVQQQSHSGLSGRQSVEPASNEHSEHQTGVTLNDRAHKPKFVAVQVLETESKPTAGFASFGSLLSNMPNQGQPASHVTPEQNDHIAGREQRTTTVPLLDFSQMRQVDKFEMKYDDDQLMAQVIRQLIPESKKELEANKHSQKVVKTNEGQISHVQRPGVATASKPEIEAQGRGLENIEPQGLLSMQALVRQSLFHIYERAAEAVAEEATKRLVQSPDKVKRQIKKATKVPIQPSCASEVLGLDHEHRDPEAIDYEATHLIETARSGQENEPSYEVEIFSVNSGDEEPSIRQGSMIVLFEKLQSEMNVQRKQRNIVPMPKVSAIQMESPVQKSETVKTSDSCSGPEPQIHDRGPSKLNVQIDLADTRVRVPSATKLLQLEETPLRTQKTSKPRTQDKHLHSPLSNNHHLKQLHAAKSEANLLQQSAAKPKPAINYGYLPTPNSAFYQTGPLQPQMSLLPFDPYTTLPQLQALHRMSSLVASSGFLFPLEEQDRLEAQMRDLLWTTQMRPRKLKGFKRLRNSDASAQTLKPQTQKPNTEPNVSFANMSTQQENQQQPLIAYNDRKLRIQLNQVEARHSQMHQDRNQETSGLTVGLGSQLFLNPIFKPQYSVRPMSMRLRLEQGYYQPITLDAFVDDCRLTMRAAVDEQSLHGCFEDGPSPINGPQKQQYFDIQRDDSPLSAHDKPLNNAFVVIGDSYYRVKDMVAQDESESQRLPTEHSEQIGHSNAFQTVLDAPSDGDEPRDEKARTPEVVHQTIMKRRVTDGTASQSTLLKQTPTGPEKKQVGFDVMPDLPLGLAHSEQWKREDGKLDVLDPKRASFKGTRFAMGTETRAAEVDQAAADSPAPPLVKRASTSLSAFTREEARRGVAAKQKQQKWWTDEVYKLIDEYQDNKNKIGNDDAPVNDLSNPSLESFSVTSQFQPFQLQYHRLIEDDYGFWYLGLVNATRKEFLLEEERVMQLFKRKPPKVRNDFGRRNSSVDGYSIGSGRPLGAGRRLQFASSRQQSAHVAGSRRAGSEYSYNMEISFANCSEYFQVLEDDFPIDSQVVSDFYRKTKKRELHHQEDHEKLDRQYEAYEHTSGAESLMGRIASLQKQDKKLTKANEEPQKSRSSIGGVNRSQTSIFNKLSKRSLSGKRLPGSRKVQKLQSLGQYALKVINPDASTRRQRKEEDDTFNQTYTRLLEIFKEKEAINRDSVPFLRLFSIHSLVDNSALFRSRTEELAVDFKLLSRQRFSVKFMTHIKKLITNSGYARYNTHVWEYSQIGKMAYYVNGQKARTMFNKAIQRNPEELRRFYRDSCIDANIPLFRASINQQIQDACFKNKDKLLYTVLYRQADYKQPQAYIDQVLKIIEEQSSYDTAEQREVLNKLNQTLCKDIRQAYERHCQEQKVNARRERQVVLQSEKSIRKRQPDPRYPISDVLYFINFHKPGSKEPWVHQEYMDSLHKQGGQPITPYRPTDHALELLDKHSKLAGHKNGPSKLFLQSMHHSSSKAFKQTTQQDGSFYRQEEYPFKLNDYFGYRSLIISQGFYQIFEPVLAKARTSGALPKQQSAEWLDGGPASAGFLSKFNTMKMGTSSRDLLTNLHGRSGVRETTLRALQQRKKSYTADSFGTAVAVRNQALQEQKEIEQSSALTEELESDGISEQGEDCSPITFHKAPDKSGSQKQQQAPQIFSEKNSQSKSKGSMSSLMQSVTRITSTPGKLQSEDQKSVSMKSEANKFSKIVVTCVDEEKEHDEAHLGRARTLKSDKYSTRQSPRGQQQLQEGLRTSDKNFSKRSKTKLILTGDSMREENLTMVYEEESQLNSQRESHRYANNIRKIGKHRKKPSSVDFDNNPDELDLAEVKQESNSSSEDFQSEQLSADSRNAKSALPNDSDGGEKDLASGPRRFGALNPSTRRVKNEYVERQLRLLAAHGEDPATQRRPTTRPRIPFGNTMDDQSHESDTMLAVLAEEGSGGDRADSEDEVTTDQRWDQDEEDPEMVWDRVDAGQRGHSLAAAQSAGNLLGQSSMHRIPEITQRTGLGPSSSSIKQLAQIHNAPMAISQAGSKLREKFSKSKIMPRGASADNVVLENSLAQTNQAKATPAKTEKRTLTIFTKISQRSLNQKLQKQDVPLFAGGRRRTIRLDNFDPQKKATKLARPRSNFKIQPFNVEEFTEEGANLLTSKTQKGTIKGGISSQIASKIKKSDGNMFRVTISMSDKAANLLKIKSQETRQQEKQVFIQSLENREKHKVFQAIERNQPQVVEEFISRNMMSLNTCTDPLGNSLLNVAVQCGCEEIVDALIKNGAYINTQNHLGNTPLHYAISYNFTKLVDLLMESGADETIKNLKRHTPWQGI